MATFIADKGEDFIVQQLDRSYKGGLVEAFKVDGGTGVVTVAGQTISSSGVIGSTGAVTATTVHATGAVTLDTTLAVTGASTLTGNTTVGGTFGVTGATTLPAATTIGSKTPMTGSLYSAVIAGANAGSAPVSTVLAGAVIGDKVVAVVNLTGAADVQADFETAVTVTDHIQQTSANLTAATAILVILQHL